MQELLRGVSQNVRFGGVGIVPGVETRRSVAEAVRAAKPAPVKDEQLAAVRTTESGQGEKTIQAIVSIDAGRQITHRDRHHGTIIRGTHRHILHHFEQ